MCLRQVTCLTLHFFLLPLQTFNSLLAISLNLAQSSFPLSKVLPLILSERSLPLYIHSIMFMYSFIIKCIIEHLLCAQGTGRGGYSTDMTYLV